MRRTAPLRLVALVAAGLAVAPSAAAIDVFLISPRPQVGVFGDVTIEADVLSPEGATTVVFRVDGRVVGRLSEPPWRLTVDVGQGNVPHTFEAIATDATGATATARVVTRTIAVDEAVDLELQQLYVTVTRGGQRVTDLPRSAFTVYDEGEAQELVTFEQGDVPLAATLLVDTSVSMEGRRIRAALEGARAFADSMRPLDRTSLMLFSDRLLHLTPFTGDAATISAGLNGVAAAGGTALNDHLYAALKRLDVEQGRRVVVLLSDGIDVESVLSIEDVLWKAQRSQALVYWIRLLDSETGPVVSRTSAWRDTAGHRREQDGLVRLVEQSGGRIVDLSRIEEAPGAFRAILSELRDQYVLGYYPSVNRNDGRWHRVQVRVPGFGNAVRTREGYVDF